MVYPSGTLVVPFWYPSFGPFWLLIVWLAGLLSVLPTGLDKVEGKAM
jgi:hypothetical protein